MVPVGEPEDEAVEESERHDIDDNKSYFSTLLTSLGPGSGQVDRQGREEHVPQEVTVPSALTFPPANHPGELMVDTCSGPREPENAVVSEPRLRDVLSDSLTGHFLDDAMVARCGHSFGSATLLRVRETGKCQVCDAPVESGTLVPNLVVRAAVAAYRREAGELPMLAQSSAQRVKRKRDAMEPPDSSLQSKHPLQEREQGARMSLPQSFHSASQRVLPAAAQSGLNPPSRGLPFPFSVGDRVQIRGNKRTPDRFVGRAALVTTQCLNGWYLVQTLDSPQEEVRLQYRSLEKLSPAGAALPSPVPPRRKVGREMRAAADATAAAMVQPTASSATPQGTAAVRGSRARSRTRHPPSNLCSGLSEKGQLSYLDLDDSLPVPSGSLDVVDIFTSSSFLEDQANGVVPSVQPGEARAPPTEASMGGALRSADALHGLQSSAAAHVPHAKLDPDGHWNAESLVAPGLRNSLGELPDGSGEGAKEARSLGCSIEQVGQAAEGKGQPLVAGPSAAEGGTLSERGAMDAVENAVPSGDAALEAGVDSEAGLERRSRRESERETLRVMRRDMLRLEVELPWPGVRRLWRVRRAVWRRSVKDANSIADMALRMAELRSALLLQSAGFMSDDEWDRQLQAAAADDGDCKLLQTLWHRLHDDVDQWLQVTLALSSTSRQQGNKPNLLPGSSGRPHAQDQLAAKMQSLFPWFENARACLPPAAVSAAAAVAAASAAANNDIAAEEMRAVSVQLLSRHQRDELAALRTALERERRHLSALLEQLEDAKPPLGYPRGMPHPPPLLEAVSPLEEESNGDDDEAPIASKNLVYHKPEFCGEDAALLNPGEVNDVTVHESLLLRQDSQEGDYALAMAADDASEDKAGHQGPPQDGANHGDAERADDDTATCTDTDMSGGEADMRRDKQSMLPAKNSSLNLQIEGKQLSEDFTEIVNDTESD